MKIALIGYGKMGRTIEKIALQRRHEIVARIDVDNQGDFASPAFRSADVAIEFTAPSTAFENYLRCFAAGLPVVSGTTGWTSRINEIKNLCETEGRTFFYASNFSIGVNIFFALNKYLARIMNGFPNYDVDMTEIHHIHKLDAPSGTAITLAEDIIYNLERKKAWKLADGQHGDGDLLITAVREDEVPGTHEIRYTSDVDDITIRHNAQNREGFALGAVLAAEFTAGRKGFLGMKDLLKF
ncbi:MAG: 4-hydroxy-tetrahydrodipicolinate reductase [Tannerella sp.]|jgi:4-hydroxy-tetrahydrodipicolinate reductase|nr:4-hydroxy-tetrahydrodipicolinate reductase [Tannerella sp.]